MRTPYLKTPLTLVASAILFASTSVLAVPKTTEDTLLPTLQVQAKQIQAPFMDDQSTVSEITQKNMQQNLVHNLDDLVRFEPGVDVSQDARFGIGSVNIRGLDGNRVKIAVDDVDQAKAYGPSVTFLRAGRNTVDLDSLEKVTISKGGDVLAGSGALGGVVEYKTKEPSSFLSPEGDDRFFSFKAGYRSAMDQLSETITAVNRSGKLDTLLVYTHRNSGETKNYYGDAGSDKTVGAKRQSVDPADNQANNVLAKAQYQLNERNRIGFVGEYYDASSSSDLYSESTANDFHRADDNNIRQRMGVFWENKQPKFLYDQMKWRLNYQDTKTTDKTYRKKNTKTRIYDRFYDEKTISLQGDFVKNFSQQVLRYGLNYKQTSLENLNKDNVVGTFRFSPLADANIMGMYVEDTLDVTDRLTLIPALRYDNYQYRTKGDQYISAYPDSKNSALSAQIGAEFELTPVYSLYGKYGKGFRAPGLGDLYYYYDGGRGYAIVPNPNLEPETSVFTEGGLRAQNDYGSAEFALFYNDYKNFIESDAPIGKTQAHPYGEFTTKNLDRVVIKGAEFKGSLSLSDVKESLAEGWSLNSAVAYAKGENKKTHQPVDSVAPLSAVFGLSYDAPSQMWGTQLNMTFNTGKDKKDITTSHQWLATKSYQVVDMTGYYKPTDTVTINAGVFNLFNKKYQKWSDVRNVSSGLGMGQTGAPITNLQRYTRTGRNLGVDVTVTF